MKIRRIEMAAGALLIALASTLLQAQARTTQPIPDRDTSLMSPDGTAHITRVVPVPQTISPEAQKFLAAPFPDLGSMTLEQRRHATDIWQAERGKEFRTEYPVDVQNDTMAGVPVRIISPTAVPAGNRDRVLINLHGGGFDSDSGSLTETVPIANLTKIKVVAVLYRLMPEHPFPAAVDDAVAVYREILKTYSPSHVCMYGTSAGAILTPQVAVRLRQLGLPLPACLGVFSGIGDFTRRGDSQAMFGLFGLKGPLAMPQEHAGSQAIKRAAQAGAKDPMRSPLFADLKGFPPTLFITSERDMLLSGTTILHRAFLRAGVPAELIVFEGLPHAFWNHPGMPETKEADEDMAAFFTRQLSGAATVK
jgi:monoterpene epsilon-lactone hydrolase